MLRWGAPKGGDNHSQDNLSPLPVLSLDIGENQSARKTEKGQEATAENIVKIYLTY